MQELIFGLIGGTALLMYGVKLMGEGLEKASGDTMKKILTVLTGNVWSAFLVGIFITAIVQSSTAVTVMTVGFVSSGLMKFSQAVGIIYGANIGTTVIAQLMAFSFKFNLTDIALPILGIGFGINQMVKNRQLKYVGQALMGFGMMFLGLKILNSGVPYMQENQSLQYFFTHYASIPVVGIFLGMFVTAMVHSSAATIGLVMILSQAGLLDLHSAIYIILGNNIGTCFTAQIASMAGSVNARRTAWAHTLYNVIGVIVALVGLPIFLKIVITVTDNLYTNANISVYIANSHTMFNVMNALIFLPLTKYYVMFLNRVIREKDKTGGKLLLLDPLLLDTPIAALEAVRAELVVGIEILQVMIKDVMYIIYTGDDKRMPVILENEDIINLMQINLTKYVVEISRKNLTEAQSVMVTAMITSMNNIERAGDRIIELCRLYNKKSEGDLLFTEDAIIELQELEDNIINLFENTAITLKKRELVIIEKIVQYEDKIDEISEAFQENHIKRLNEGTCDVDPGVLFIDMVSNLERIADHVYKIAMYTKDELFGEKRKYDK
ncbi:MAG: Na/Pi cotransporter family protein [Tissierellia bacterium]|nr:Na/Pi cotransporter family protein [Tissierellia bacterium]